MINMPKMRNVIIYLLLLGFVAVQAGGFKKYAGEFISAGVGSRALAMGGAFVAVANDVTAGYWNPAGLVEANGIQVQFMHAKQFMASIQYDYLAASAKLDESSALAVSLIRWGVNDIKDSRDALRGTSISEGIDYSKIVSFNVADYALFVSYSRQYSEHLAIGANIKIINRDYASENALGIGFDAGLKYKLSPNLALGLMVRDITTTMMAWSTNEKEFISPSIRPGISYRYDFEDIGLYVQPTADLAILFESRNKSAQIGMGILSVDSFWGMETGFRDICFLRLGYDDLGRFNAGIGLSITKFAIDYSYTNFDNLLGNVHRISFHLKIPTL